MTMSAFAKWYLTKLKTHPMMTNMASALVLTMTGDAMAQQFEHYEQNKDAEAESTPETSQLRPYTTSVSTAAHDLLHLLHDRLLTVGTLLSLKGNSINTTKSEPAFISMSAVKSSQQPHHQHDLQLLVLQGGERHTESHNNDNLLQWQALDPIRTAKMAVWGVGLYAPFFVNLFRLYDCYLPLSGSTMGVASRVVGNFIVCVPMNAAFFSYNTVVQKGVEWFQQQKEQLDSFDYSSFDSTAAWSAVKTKLDKELVQTIQTSAGVWIPLNILNFAVVPPHLRTVATMGGTMFWNCYLSVAQHRD